MLLCKGIKDKVIATLPQLLLTTCGSKVELGKSPICYFSFELQTPLLDKYCHNQSSCTPLIFGYYFNLDLPKTVQKVV